MEGVCLLCALALYTLYVHKHHMAHLSSPANFAIGFWFIIVVTEVLSVVRGTEHICLSSIPVLSAKYVLSSRDERACVRHNSEKIFFRYYRFFFLYLRNARVMSTPVFFARTRLTHVGFCFVQAFVVTKIFRVNNSDL